MNVFQLTEPMIYRLFDREAKAGMHLYELGRVSGMKIDGEVVAGIVTEDNGEETATEFNFDLSKISAFSRTTKQMRVCAAALMSAWVRERESFFPPMGTPQANALIQNRSFITALGAAIGDKNITQYLADLHGRQLVRQKHEKVAAPGQTPITTGAGFWELPNLPPAAMQPLAALLDAEFTTPQLRELARWLDVKLHGNAKSGYIQTILGGLSLRMAEMENNPDALLRGLNPELADFARRIFTARDWQLAVPRSTLQTLLGIHAPKDFDRKLTELTEGLRRYALLFPSHRPTFYGIRDSFYQLLPLDPATLRPPVLAWEGVTRGQAGAASPRAAFLDQFDGFVSAVMSGGAELRPSRTPHPRAGQIAWLRGWEHELSETDALLNSRVGWGPDLNSGVSLVLDSPLSENGRAVLSNQTGQDPLDTEFYFALAAALQLIEAPDKKGKTPQPVLPAHAVHARARASAVEEWMALSDHARARRAWDSWQNSLPFAVEISHAGNFLVMRRIGDQEFNAVDFAAEMCALRRYAARILRGLPAGALIDWPALRKKLFAFYPSCAWQTHTVFTWWFANTANRGRINTNSEADWNRTIGAVLERMFGHAMPLLGAAEAEFDKNDHLAVFRLTELGQWLLANGASADFPDAAKSRPKEAEPVRWLDEDRLRLPPAPDRAAFIRFVRAVAEPADEPFTYSITRASLENALKTGVSADEIARPFEEMNAPLPAKAQAMLANITARFGKIRVYEGLTVLQLGDDLALRELLAATSLGQRIRYQISPRAVVIDDAAVPELLAELEGRGYTPAVKG